MKIVHREDLNVEDWHPDGIGDWLHPVHGPTPDRLSIYTCQDEESIYCTKEETFVVALWVGEEFLTVMLEMQKEEPPWPSRELLPHDEVHKMRGWILQTYRWELSEDGLKCRDYVVGIPDEAMEDDEWATDLCNQAMWGSLTLAMTEKIGDWRVALA